MENEELKKLFTSVGRVSITVSDITDSLQHFTGDRHTATPPHYETTKNILPKSRSRRYF